MTWKIRVKAINKIMNENCEWKLRTKTMNENRE